MGTFIGVLKPPPSADVVDEDVIEISSALADVGDQADQTWPVFYRQTTLTIVPICSNNFEPACLCVGSDDSSLILDGVLLVVRRHADVLRSAERPLRFWQRDFVRNERIDHRTGLGCIARLAIYNSLPERDVLES